ncbi:hypothetical protein ACWJUT_26560, partial [Escherichia coli]
PVGDFELLLCHGTVCVVGKMRDLILQLSKSSIYSTKPISSPNDVIPRNIMTLLITQEGIFYDKEDLASNKTYLFYLSFKLNKKPR